MTSYAIMWLIASTQRRLNLEPCAKHPADVPATENVGCADAVRKNGIYLEELRTSYLLQKIHEKG